MTETVAPTRAGRAGDQALPKAGGTAVGPLVIADVQRRDGFHGDVIIKQIVADLEARIQLGTERYGHPLETHNGRDAALDAYQELLDAAHYLKQLHIETHNPRAQIAYWSVLGLVFDLRELMARLSELGTRKDGA